MSFKVNSSQQISFNDSVFSLTAREKKALDNSWAKIFADEIFPNIDEERFSVLYSSKASRPNAPVNVIIGALIIKELFDYSDDEIVENLMLDLHLQYALHTTSFEEQPISDKTLSRFRSRCYNYETTHGIDLYHDCVKDLSICVTMLQSNISNSSLAGTPVRVLILLWQVLLHLRNGFVVEHVQFTDVSGLPRLIPPAVVDDSRALPHIVQRHAIPVEPVKGE